MYSIHSSMNPKCTNENEQVKNNIQLGATGDVRPCNYYGTRLNWQYFEKWAIDKGFDLTKLNIRNSTMKEIYESLLDYMKRCFDDDFENSGGNNSKKRGNVRYCAQCVEIAENGLKSRCFV